MKKSARGLIYGITLFLITLTGFAQMPIFKRYYIADLPGLGWLARFYVTHSIHYAMASVLIALAVFATLEFVLAGKRRSVLTVTGRIKAFFILGLIVTGTLMVVRNLPGSHFSHVAIYAMNLAHLGLCMGLIFVSVSGWVMKKSWTR